MSNEHATPSMWEPADPVMLRGRKGRFTPGPAPARKAKLEVEPGPPPQKRPPSWTPSQPTRTVTPRQLERDDFSRPVPGLDYAPPSEAPTRHVEEPILAPDVVLDAGIPSDWQGAEADWFDGEAHDADFTVEPAPTRTQGVVKPDLFVAAAIAGGVLLLSTLVAAGAIMAAVLG